MLVLQQSKQTRAKYSSLHHMSMSSVGLLLQSDSFVEASNKRPLPAALHFIPWRLAGQVMRYLCELRPTELQSQRYVSCILTIVDSHATKPLNSGLHVRVVILQLPGMKLIMPVWP